LEKGKNTLKAKKRRYEAIDPPTRFLCRFLRVCAVRNANCFMTSSCFQLNGYEVRKGKSIAILPSLNNHRLFVGNIPKNRDREELFEEFSKHARKSDNVPTEQANEV
jgi:hypothetical protein